MLVKLRNDWFAPNGTLYRANQSPHVVSDRWKDLLPPSAINIDETEEPEVPDAELVGDH